MTSPEHNGHGNGGISDAAEADAQVISGVTETAGAPVHDGTSEVVTVAATVGIVAVGAALFEAALLPGIAIGVAAMLAPKYVPKVGTALTPMFRSSVRGAYKLGQRTREFVAEAKEQVHDIVAEVHAEKDVPPAAAKAGTEPPPA